VTHPAPFTIVFFRLVFSLVVGTAVVVSAFCDLVAILLRWFAV
jgi:hypothetical protein